MINRNEFVIIEMSDLTKVVKHEHNCMKFGIGGFSNEKDYRGKAVS